MAAFDAATGRSAYKRAALNDAAALVPLVIQQAGIVRRILQKDFNNLVPASGVAYNLTDRMSCARDSASTTTILNLNELQFTAIPPYHGQFSLNPPAAAPLQVDNLFLFEQHPAVPCAVLAGPANRTPYTTQWNVNFHASLEPTTSSRRLHGQPNPESEQTVQHQPCHFGRRTSTRGCLSPISARMLIRGDRNRGFRGLSLRLENATPPGSSSPPTTSCRRNRDTAHGRSEANEHRVRADPECRREPVAVPQRHRGAFSFGYDSRFGEDRIG